jgi:hypothetical protein
MFGAITVAGCISTASACTPAIMRAFEPIGKKSSVLLPLHAASFISPRLTLTPSLNGLFTLKLKNCRPRARGTHQIYRPLTSAGSTRSVRLPLSSRLNIADAA